MNNMINVTTTKVETIKSMEVAQMVGKEHKYLLRDIRRYINQISKSNETNLTGDEIAPVEFFIKNEYVDSKGEIRSCYNITRKGCDFIGNKLTGQKGTEFTARYVSRFHELEENNITHSFIVTLQNISDSMKTITDRIEKLEQIQQSAQQLPKKSFSHWTSMMFPKYQLLMDYFDITRKELYHNLYIELQNTYPDIDLKQEQDDYCYENGLDNCFTLDVIEHNKNIRNLFESIVNNLLDKYNLIEINSETSGRRRTIFDD